MLWLKLGFTTTGSGAICGRGLEGGKAAEAPLKHGHNILWSALF